MTIQCLACAHILQLTQFKRRRAERFPGFCLVLLFPEIVIVSVVRPSQRMQFQQKRPKR